MAFSGIAARCNANLAHMFTLANLSPRRIYLLAVGCMLASTASFSLMNMFIRMLSDDSIHTTAIVFWRNLFAVAVLLPWALKNGAALLQTQRLGSHFWRATIGIIGMQSWFFAVASLPLNHATALSFTAPLFTTLFAMLFLKESADALRWGGLLVGFVGVLIILRPDTAHFELASMVVLFATSMWAIAGMLVKSLTRTEPPLRIIFYMALFMMLWAFPMALPHWSWPNAPQLLLLAVVALASTSAHWFLVKAYSLCDVVKLMPFDFARLIFTAIFAWLFFHETSDAQSWLGASVIVASAFVIARRDALRTQA